MADYALPIRIVRHTPTGARHIINASDFDPAVHAEWTEADPVDLDAPVFAADAFAQATADLPDAPPPARDLTTRKARK